VAWWEETGSGKTTLVKHFNRLLSQSVGLIKVLGQEAETNEWLTYPVTLVCLANPNDQLSRQTYGRGAHGPESYTHDQMVHGLIERFGLSHFLIVTLSAQ